MEVFGSPLTALWVGRIVSIILGGAAGYGYYRVIGCRSGVCPITANPWISTLYGAAIGGLMFWN